MTIYDVPVDDTVFFPVSGDMLRQMKHEEENGTGNPAKSSPDAADLNDYQEEQITMNDTGIVPAPADTNASHWHPLWCDPVCCLPPTLPHLGDEPVHVHPIGTVYPREAARREDEINVELVQAGRGQPKILVSGGDVELEADELDGLIRALRIASARLAEVS